MVVAIVALLIRLDSPGPIFYRQRRVGQHGVEFTLLKFRSMFVDSDDSIHREAIEKYMNGEKVSQGNAPTRGGASSPCVNAEASAPQNGEGLTTALLYKRADDPRVTRVGRFLRKASIDELPQFFNVLRGEMTLVGPRPPLPYEVERYSSHDQLRLSGKPGLTGFWQVYGRSTVPFQSMVEMDIAYLEKQSLREDLKLIALTIPVMLLGRGGA